MTFQSCWQKLTDLAPFKRELAPNPILEKGCRLLLPGFLQSLPIRTHCFCCRPSKCWSHLAARDASDKHKAAQASPGLRTLQWLPITLRPKSELLTVASQDPGDLTAAHTGRLISIAVLVPLVQATKGLLQRLANLQSTLPRTERVNFLKLQVRAPKLPA